MNSTPRRRALHRLARHGRLVLMDRLRARTTSRSWTPCSSPPPPLGSRYRTIDGLQRHGHPAGRPRPRGACELPALVTTHWRGLHHGRPRSRPAAGWTASGSTPPPRCAWTTTP
ncbi:hypothetical protein QJS66_20040 [Kocuria rhizophila]|nr:hypothetical protein QJS66_20040 [Kocuria rhizophila]